MPAWSAGPVRRPKAPDRIRDYESERPGLTQAQVVLGDFAAAQVNYLQALERPGPHTQSIRNELEAVRLELRLEAIRSER